MPKEHYCAWCKDPLGPETTACPRCGAALCDLICLAAHLHADCKKGK